MNEQRKASSVKKMISSIIHHVATKVIVSMIIGWIAAVQANQIVPKTKEIALVVMPAVSARTYYKGEIIRSYSLLFRSNAGNPYDDKPQIDKLDLSDEYDGWATRFMASMNECAASRDVRLTVYGYASRAEFKDYQKSSNEMNLAVANARARRAATHLRAFTLSDRVSIQPYLWKSFDDMKINKPIKDEVDGASLQEYINRSVDIRIDDAGDCRRNLVAITGFPG